MKKLIARMLRRGADRLDPQPTNLTVPFVPVHISPDVSVGSAGSFRITHSSGFGDGPFNSTSGPHYT